MYQRNIPVPETSHGTPARSVALQSLHSKYHSFRQRHFVFLVLEGSNLLDIGSAIEPLSLANELCGKDVFSWSLTGEAAAHVNCSNGVPLAVSGAPDEMGRQDCIMVCSGFSGFQSAGERTLQWLRGHHRHGGVVGALGTGAFTLARAGIVGDRSVTLHWRLIPLFREMFPRIEVRDALYLEDGRILTSAGGTAGLDMMLAMIGRFHGDELSAAVSDICLHEVGRPQNRIGGHSIACRIGTRHPVLIRILRRMEEAIAEPVPLNEFTCRESISRRQIERLFRKHLHRTPKQYYLDLRLDRARQLLLTTDHSIMDIALATGFSGAAHFGRLFRKRFGYPPTQSRAARD